MTLNYILSFLSCFIYDLDKMTRIIPKVNIFVEEMYMNIHINIYTYIASIAYSDFNTKIENKD